MKRIILLCFLALPFLVFSQVAITFSDEFEIKSSSISGEGPLKFPSEEEYGLKAILTSFGELEGPIIKAIWPSEL